MKHYQGLEFKMSRTAVREPEVAPWSFVGQDSLKIAEVKLDFAEESFGSAHSYLERVPLYFLTLCSAESPFGALLVTPTLRGEQDFMRLGHLATVYHHDRIDNLLQYMKDERNYATINLI